jgi:hypothetical protein
MRLLRTLLATASAPKLAVLLMVTMSGCEEVCTPLMGVVEDRTLDAEEQALVDEYGYFNLVGDCVGEQDLECEERVPDGCDVACSDGATCVQVEFESIECRDIVEWSQLLPGYDSGYKWKRKCVEIPAGG